VPVHTHDSPLGRNRMHDPETVPVKQAVELGRQWAKAAGLDLHELSPSARIRSITNWSTGTSSRSPGAASIALIAACSAPSRSTPMLDTPQRLEAASARSRQP
jgi:hypothetical protein